MNLNSIIAYTDTETVKLDFDDTAFSQVKKWSLRIMKRFRLEGFLILKSSLNNYHVVFNRPVSWSENVKIVAWISLYSRKVKLDKWFHLQCIKEESTLRVSPKGVKPPPRIVFRYGRQEKEIKSFLLHRKVIKSIIKKMEAKREKKRPRAMRLSEKRELRKLQQHFRC